MKRKTNKQKEKRTKNNNEKEQKVMMYLRAESGIKARFFC